MLKVQMKTKINEFKNRGEDENENFRKNYTNYIFLCYVNISDFSMFTSV